MDDSSLRPRPGETAEEAVARVVGAVKLRPRFGQAPSNLNLTACSMCGETILVCDNDVWLDWPARPWDATAAPWFLMIVGDIAVAQTAADAEPGFEGYALHLHQPL